PAPVKVHADVNVFAAEISPGRELAFDVRAGRQAYLVLIEVRAKIEEYELAARDAMEITEQNITVLADDTAHVIVLEMRKSAATFGRR
ncbi:MAG: pirin family protein, partial [Spirochaetales bacterium]|nr:pirin family protein [Spirochaetales bacterium]